MKSVIPNIGWVMLALAALLSFVMDWAHIAHGGEVDFRNRITGSRLLAHGIDSYHYKWQPGDPTEYCDPRDHPSLPISRTTVTPTLLLLHLPLAMMPYRPAQLLWLAMQWVLLLGTGWVWMGASTVSRMRWLIALIVVAFSFTASWRLHAERGQCYVLLTFLFACWLAATLDSNEVLILWRGAWQDS